MEPPLQFQGESNHHANAEMIDMAGVSFSTKASRRKILPTAAGFSIRWRMDGGLMSM
jgi:hypothetical protein